MTGLLTQRVQDAVDALLTGGLVALPTETVYGLGADADNPRAVARVYAVKGRPVDHPVIVHCASAADVDDWVRSFPDWARQLASACWPGPLTLILPRSQRARDYLTGGQQTVGVRVPGHPVMQEVLAGFGGAIAAPSANLFGRVSPTTAQHVLTELGGRLNPDTDRILDGGACAVGVESTIIDATGEQPRMLRPGGISRDQVEQITGRPVLVADGRIRSPGSLTTHYAPSASVLLTEPSEAADLLKRLSAGGSAATIGLIALADVTVDLPEAVTRLSTPADVTQYAKDLYAALRSADDRGMDVVVAVLPADHGVGTAVRDRLRRSAAERTSLEPS